MFGTCVPQYTWGAAATEIRVVLLTTGSIGSNTQEYANRYWGAIWGGDNWAGTDAPTFGVNSTSSNTINLILDGLTYPNNRGVTFSPSGYCSTTFTTEFGKNMQPRGYGTWEHVAGHEFGHALGMGHTNAGPAVQHIMGPGSSWGASGSGTYCSLCKKTPSADDAAGVNYLYL